MRTSSPALVAVSLLFCGLIPSCLSTETGNPVQPTGDGPNLREVSLQLTVHRPQVVGSAGAPNADDSQLTALTLKLSEIEAIDCAKKSVVTAFNQAGTWGSGSQEKAQLPEGSTCRLIVRAMPLEKGASPEATPGAYISGDTGAGPFRLLAPAPIGGFLKVLSPDLDLTSVDDLRLEISEERLLPEIETLLGTSSSGLLVPGSPETLRLSRALGDSLDLVSGQGAARVVLASAAQPSSASLCDDFCGSYARAGCMEDCDVAICQDSRVEPTCGATFEDWVSCIVRSPSEQLLCDSGLLSDTDSICQASRSAYENCKQGGAP